MAVLLNQNLIKSSQMKMLWCRPVAGEGVISEIYRSVTFNQKVKILIGTLFFFFQFHWLFSIEKKMYLSSSVVIFSFQMGN